MTESQQSMIEQCIHKQTVSWQSVILVSAIAWLLMLPHVGNVDTDSELPNQIGFVKCTHCDTDKCSQVNFNIVIFCPKLVILLICWYSLAMRQIKQIMNNFKCNCNSQEL